MLPIFDVPNGWMAKRTTIMAQEIPTIVLVSISGTATFSPKFSAGQQGFITVGFKNAAYLG